MCRLSIQASDIEHKALPNDVCNAIPVEWPPSTELYADIPNWSAGYTGNIFETYATCIFPMGGPQARKLLRSLLWATLLADPRAAKALARHCKAKGRVKGIPPSALDGKETQLINLSEQPIPPSEDEEEGPRGKREAVAIATDFQTGG